MMRSKLLFVFGGESVAVQLNSFSLDRDDFLHGAVQSPIYSSRKQYSPTECPQLTQHPDVIEGTFSFKNIIQIILYSISLIPNLKFMIFVVIFYFDNCFFLLNY